MPFDGPHVILGIDKENNLVKLRVPGIGRGGPLVLKNVSMTNIKPYLRSADGDVLLISDRTRGMWTEDVYTCDTFSMDTDSSCVEGYMW